VKLTIKIVYFKRAVGLPVSLTVPCWNTTYYSSLFVVAQTPWTSCDTDTQWHQIRMSQTQRVIRLY